MSEIIVLDTHMWLWFVNANFEQFSDRWRERIEHADRVGISPVSCFEIALAHQRGRLLLPCMAGEWCREALAPAGIEIFPLTPDIAVRAVNLSPVHRDPFDRIIIATALENRARLASMDGVFPRYAELTDCLLE